MSTSKQKQFTLHGAHDRVGVGSRGFEPTDSGPEPYEILHFRMPVPEIAIPEPQAVRVEILTDCRCNELELAARRFGLHLYDTYGLPARKPLDVNQTAEEMESGEVSDADLLVILGCGFQVGEEMRKAVVSHCDRGRPVVFFGADGDIVSGGCEWTRDILGVVSRPLSVEDEMMWVRPAGPGGRHPLVQSLAPFRAKCCQSFFEPVGQAAVPLLFGISGISAVPVAWVHQYRSARVFHTALGRADDFDVPECLQLMTDAVLWALDD